MEGVELPPMTMYPMPLLGLVRSTRVLAMLHLRCQASRNAFDLMLHARLYRRTEDGGLATISDLVQGPITRR